jgi:hypothetical protein
VGDTVAEDEVVLEIETDKVGFYLRRSFLFVFIYLFICCCSNDATQAV